MILYNYVKDVKNLEKYATNFFYWVQILVKDLKITYYQIKI